MKIEGLQARSIVILLIIATFFVATPASTLDCIGAGMECPKKCDYTGWCQSSEIATQGCVQVSGGCLGASCTGGC